VGVVDDTYLKMEVKMKMKMKMKEVFLKWHYTGGVFGQDHRMREWL
jgi:hypothetical protein